MKSPVSFVLDRLVADPNIEPQLVRAFERCQQSRFTGAPPSGYMPLLPDEPDFAQIAQDDRDAFDVPDDPPPHAFRSDPR